MGEFLVPLFVAFLDLHVRSGEYRRDIGAQKGGVTEHETGMAASVDRLEDVSVRRLYGSPPVQLSPKDLDEVGILGKRLRKADAVVTIPRGFNLLQESSQRRTTQMPIRGRFADQPSRNSISPVLRLNRG